MRAIALEIEDHPVAKLRMPHAAAHAHPRGRRLIQGAAALDENRPRHLQSRPYLLDEFRRQFADESRWLAIGVHTIEPALFGIGDIEMAHGSRRADVAKPALLLQSGEICHRALMRKQ